MTKTDIIRDLIECLAEAEGRHAEELDYILHDYIDPEILQKLDAMEYGIWELTFQISDHQVTLTHEGSVFIDGVQYQRDRTMTSSDG